MNLKFDLKENRLNFPEAEVHMPGLAAECRGYIRLQKPFEYLFDLNSKIDTDVIKNILQYKKSLSGTISLNNRVEGTGSEFKLTGSYEGAPVVFDTFHSDRLSGKILWTPRVLNLSEIQCETMGGQINGSFSTGKEDLRRVMQAKFDFHSVDLETVIKNLDFQVIRVAGRASGNGAFTWEKDQLFDGTGNLELRIKPPAQLSVGPRVPIPLDADISCTMEQQKIEFSGSRVSFTDSNINFDGTLGLDKAGSLSIEASTGSLAETDRLIQQIRRFLSKDKTAAC